MPQTSSCSINSPSSLSPIGLRPFRDTNKDHGPLGSDHGVVLKRKRPARLDIPVLGGFGFGESESGSGMMTARADEEETVVEERRDGVYGVCCRRGKRRALLMEDRFSAVVDVDGDAKKGFFGVFDGHGGAKAAEFAAKRLSKNILDEVTGINAVGVEDAVRDGYLKTDAEFLKQDDARGGGTCSVTALIRGGNLVVSNSGDCRAVMSRGGVAEALTSDHRPSRKDEKERIEAMGGYVDCRHGVWRIQGSLAVSRAIGDGHLKQWVIAEPETRIHKIESNCELLILASDGLWDKVTNQEAVDVARLHCIGISKPEPLAACKRLIEISISRGSCDDICVMLIQLEQYRL